MESKNIINIKSPLGYNVICSAHRWNNHVIEGHPMMKNRIDDVKCTIKDPLAVYGSDEWANRSVYFGRSKKSTLFTKVIVEDPNEYSETGALVSAWPQKEIKGNINEKDLRYVKSKL